MRDPVAVQAGNKVVLVYVDGRNRLFASAFDLETQVWGQEFVVPSQGVRTGTAPAIASCGDGKVDVVYVAPPQGVYQRVLSPKIENIRPNIPTTGISYSQETDLGANFAGSPSLTCSGYRQLELAGIGQNNRLLHNRYKSGGGYHDGRTISAGWQGWQEEKGTFFGTPFDGRIGGSIALASTRAGEVHMAARGRGSGPRYIFHNTYDSARYGIAPWMAVHWSGYQRYSRQRFVGSPVLAVSDKEIDLAVVGDNGNVWLAGLDTNNLARFYEVPNSPVHLGFDPIVISSGPGILDVFVTDPNYETVRHIRLYRGGGSGDYYLLPIVTYHPLVSPAAATSSGGGLIDLVAFSQQGALFHYRFLGSSRYAGAPWRPPAQIPQIGGSISIISAPVLVNIGSGQLSLFAVGNDMRLYYWHYVNGAWENPLQLQGDFDVNALQFGRTSFSSWGDGVVDLVATETSTGRIFHRRILPPATQGGTTGLQPTFEWRRTSPPTHPSPQTFNEVGGQATTTVPALTALGPYRLNLQVKGQDGRIYSNWTEPPSFIQPGSSPNLGWKGFEPISSSSGLAMLGGVIQVSDVELVTVAIGIDGRLYINRLVGEQRKDFLTLPGQTQNTIHPPPLFRPSLTLH
jgi:hypothetical protein